MNAEESTEALGKYDYRDLKKMLELEEEYRETHHAASRRSTHFTDPSTGREVPFKFYQSGKKEGEHARWPKLYKQFQKNKGIEYKLRKEFSNDVFIVQRSYYDSVENFVEAWEDGRHQEKWGE